MSVEKTGLAAPLPELLNRPPAKAPANTDKTTIQDVLGQDHVNRFPTLPPKLPKELEEKLRELSKDKCPNPAPKHLPTDMKWFPTLPPTLPPGLVDPKCPKPERPPGIFDKLEPKFQPKKDDTWLA